MTDLGKGWNNEKGREYMTDWSGKMRNKTIAFLAFIKLLKQIIILIIHFKKTNYKFEYV
jgi:hypothetical protein